MMEPNSEHRYVSTAQVATALGVSVTTVKRWVDDGILPAHKTVGGHRKLLMADVIRLMREGNLPKADLGSLAPTLPSTNLSDLDEVLPQLITALHHSDAEIVRGIIHGSYAQGTSIEDIADRLIGPAMASIGHAWEQGRLSVMQEHRATQSMVSALYELRAKLRRQAEQNRPVAVGGAPEHDSYTLPSLLAKLVLLDCGWDAINLGPHTPGGAFRTAITELKPQLIWICVTHIVNEEAFLRDYIHTYNAANNAGVAVAIGGSGLKYGGLREKMPYTFFGDGLSHLASFARNLHRRPTVPKRGRPRNDDVKPIDGEGEQPES